MEIKILMFGWEFPPHNSGGLGTACHGLARALARSGAQITFVLPRKVDVSSNYMKFVFADMPSSVKIHALDLLIHPYITSQQYKEGLVNVNPLLYGRNLFEEVRRYAAEAKRIALSEDFDVIHAHDWLSFLAGLEAKKVSGKPLVVHVHATEFDRAGSDSVVNSHVYDVEKEGMEKADTIVAVSNFTKNIIIRHYGIDPEKIKVVHNGIDMEEHSSQLKLDNNLVQFKKAGNKVVLFLGRLTLQKGPDYFLKAAKKVLDYDPNVMFVISGSGDMERQIIGEAAYMGISDKVFFTGFLRGDELNKMYKLADLYVLPSVSEPFGITPLESLMNGTPVLISKRSGVSEVLQNALKVDFWDVDEMADKILSVLNHPSLHQCLRDYGREELEKISWFEAARRCMEVYGGLLSCPCSV